MQYSTSRDDVGILLIEESLNNTTYYCSMVFCYKKRFWIFGATTTVNYICANGL